MVVMGVKSSKAAEADLVPLSVRRHLPSQTLYRADDLPDDLSAEESLSTGIGSVVIAVLRDECPLSEIQFGQVRDPGLQHTIYMTISKAPFDKTLVADPLYRFSEGFTLADIDKFQGQWVSLHAEAKHELRPMTSVAVRCYPGEISIGCMGIGSANHAGGFMVEYDEDSGGMKVVCSGCSDSKNNTIFVPVEGHSIPPKDRIKTFWGDERLPLAQMCVVSGARAIIVQLQDGGVSWRLDAPHSFLPAKILSLCPEGYEVFVSGGDLVVHPAATTKVYPVLPGAQSTRTRGRAARGPHGRRH